MSIESPTQFELDTMQLLHAFYFNKMLVSEQKNHQCSERDLAIAALRRFKRLAATTTSDAKVDANKNAKRSP